MSDKWRSLIWKVGRITLLGLFLPALVFGNSVVLLQPPDYSGYGISDPRFNRVFAEDFILAQETLISQVVVWGVMSDPGANDLFTLIFHSDDSGLPGEVVATVSDLVPVHRSKTGNYVGVGLPEFVYYISLAAPVELSTGVWWLEVFNTPPGQLRWGWEGGYLDPIHGNHGCAMASEVPGNIWSPRSFHFSLLIVGSSPPFFSDTFESGDTLSWSWWVPHCSGNTDCGGGEFCKKNGCDNLIGFCKPTTGFFCIDVWDPVCGCDGVTYSNACYAEQAGVNIASTGECSP